MNPTDFMLFSFSSSQFLAIAMVVLVGSAVIGIGAWWVNQKYFS